MQNTYILIDSNHLVVNIIAMPKEPVDKTLIDKSIEQNSASYALKIEDGNVNSYVKSVSPEGTLAIGSKLIDDNIFLPERPSDDHILSEDNTSWVLPFSMRSFSENDEPVTNHELNYWD